MFEFAFNALITLLVVIDPLGLAPIFVGLTRDRSETYRREAAIKGTALGAAILFFFAFVGQGLLDALGIGLPAFRIAGGALLFLIALNMVFARSSHPQMATAREDEEAGAEEGEDISVFPIAVPLIAGPGSLATVLLYTGGSGALEVVVFLVVLFLVLLMSLASLLLAPRVLRVFGRTGTDVLARLFGVLLAALAAQFVLDGIASRFAL